MSVVIRAEWSSSHEVEPPAGMTAEQFEEELRTTGYESAAWEHALNQVESSTAELQNWEVE